MGQLKVRVGNQWENVSGGVEEVYVGPVDPYLRDPLSTYELWYDTFAIVRSRAPAGAPPTPVVQQQIFVSNGAVPAGTYYHVATALNDAGESDPTAEITVVSDGTNAQSGIAFILDPAEGLVFHHYMSTVSGIYTSHQRVVNSTPTLDSVATWSAWPDPNERPGAPGDPYPVPPPNSNGVLKARVNDAWVEVTSNADDVPEEVYVGDTDPYPGDPDAAYDLWFNTDLNRMFARVNDNWLPTDDIAPNEVFVGPTTPSPDVELWYDPNELAAPAGSNEVFIGPEDPYVTDPAATDELWFDTDDPADVSAGDIGPWAAAYAYIIGDRVTWPVGVPDVWIALRNTLVGEEPGVVADAWQNVSNRIETAGGTVQGPVTLNGQLNMGAADKIQFPNEADVAKINLYDKTFGLGIESGTTTIFGSSRVRFRVGTPTDAAKGGMTSPIMAEIEGGRLGPAANTNVSWQNGFTGSAQFRVNPAMVTLALWEFTNGVELLSYAPVKMFDYPAGVPAPWMNCTGTVMSVWMGSTYGNVPLQVECRTNGVFIMTSNYFGVGDLWKCCCSVTWAR